MNFRLYIEHYQDEDCSGIAPPNYSILCVDEFEVLEYIRESYPVYLNEISDKDLSTYARTDEGIKIILSKYHWDILKLRENKED